MFKPLLRTLPTLSGNFTIACKLREFDKESTNEYSTYVRLANMIPLQNFMANKDYELNLLNGKYEHDVSKYHYYYSDVFYKHNYSYNKYNYAILDLDSIYNYNNDSRNKDYEFGCKRIQYSQNGSQFNFYAPIYIDNENDLPEYFCINIVFNEHLTKKIKVYINKDNKRNYLKTYLSRYLKQIDERVIFCLPESMQATYFGIDVKKGGIVQYKDNLFGDLYVSQKTINNFDYTICKGFQRNNMIMRQIIPLSFSFNINDLFNVYEKEFFNGAKIKVYGHYHTCGDTLYDMYDFDINYTNSYNKYNKYNEYTGSYDFVVGKDSDNNSINIMNVGFPALNESKYIKYAYTNKITPMYCKFKMMLSDDSNPYITNVNFGYSFNQFPNQKYGEFPTMFKGLFPKVVVYNSDLKLPIGASLDKYYKVIKNVGNTLVTNTNNIDKYNKLMTNYCSSWYNIGEYYLDFTKDKTVDNFFKQSKWVDVKYGFAYFNGILYNLKQLEDIDKFAVFCSIHLNYLTEETFYNDLIKADLVLSSEISKTGKKIFAYNDSYNMKIYNKESNLTYYNKIIDMSLNDINENSIKINQNMIKDIYGTYVIEENYIEENMFYKIDDILIQFNNYLREQEILDNINEKQITGYELIEAYNNINFFIDKQSNVYGDYEKQFMLIDKVYGTQQYLDRYYWLYDKLYYTTQISKEKFKVSDNYESLYYNEDVNGKICMFLKNKYIHKNDFINIIKDYKEDLSRFGDLNTLVKRCFMYFALNELNTLNTISNIDYDIVINGETIRLSWDNWLRNEFGELYSDFSKHYAYNKFHDTLIEMIIIYNGNNIRPADVQPKNKIEGNSLIFLADLLNTVQSYKYEILGNKNGIDIEKYFTKNEINNKPIYVDPYNLSTYISLYNENNPNNKINENFTYKKFFSNILDKNHIIEYYNKLQNSEYDLNQKNILDILYVKERCWVIEKNKLEIKDRYSTLYNYLYNKFIELGDNTRIKYKSGDKKEYENTYLQCLKEYLEYFIYIYKSNDNGLILQWLTDSISNGKTKNNKFIFTVNLYDSNINEVWNIELDLCIYKNMILLDNNLRKLIDNNYFLYLFVSDKCLLENISSWDIVSQSDILNSNKYIYKDIDDYLIPLFTNIYFNEDDLEIIHQMTLSNKINQYNKYVINSNKYFKEINVDNTFREILIANDTLLYEIIDDINTLCETYDENVFTNIKTKLSNCFIIDNSFKQAISKLRMASIINNKNSYINQVKENLFCVGWIDEIKEIQKLDVIDYNNFKNNWNEYCIDNDIYIEDINKDTYIERIDLIINYLKEYHNEIYYLLIEDRGIILYSINEILNINYNKIIPDDKLYYDDTLNIYTYNFNGKKYAFYYINIDIDNTNNSFNMLNEFNMNIKFDSIDNIKISDSKFDSFFTKIFYLLEPFLKVNIFNEFSKKINTIIYPHESEINIEYMSALTNDDEIKKQYKLMNTDGKLYNDIIKMSNSKKIKLLRYFNYITPLLVKTNIIKDTWELQFMDSNNKTKNIKKYNIFSKEDINIYKYNGIKYYDGIYSSAIEGFVENNNEEIPEILYQHEYKHFNDNVLYNLPENIIVEDNKYYTYEDIYEYKENKDKLNNEKLNILLKYFNNLGLDYNNIILFLFNKYDSSMTIEPIKLRATKTEKLYKVSYKFNLI